MLLGHNVLIYCSKLISVQEEMKPFMKAFNGGTTLDSMWRNDTDTSKNVSFFQFLSHNVPINSSKLLGARKRNEALVHSFT